MSDISAQTAKLILVGLNAPGALLLRGADSILSGDDQNDIDLFIPKQSWKPAIVFGPNRLANCEDTGLPQKKVKVEVSATEEAADIDVFHVVTWRGLSLADVPALPIQRIPELGVLCLTKEAEAWLTVLKNTLHNSPTPPLKLEGVDSDPTFPIAMGRPGRLRARLDHCVARNVWAAARSGKRDWHMTCRARACLILLRVLEQPLTAFGGLLRWALWRVHGGRG